MLKSFLFHYAMFFVFSWMAFFAVVVGLAGLIMFLTWDVPTLERLTFLSLIGLRVVTAIAFVLSTGWALSDEGRREWAV